MAEKPPVAGVQKTDILAPWNDTHFDSYFDDCCNAAVGANALGSNNCEGKMQPFCSC
jgi:hypothetical protein